MNIGQKIIPDIRRTANFLAIAILSGFISWSSAQWSIAQHVNENFLTVAESSQFKATSTSAQVEELVARLVAHAPHLEAKEFGRTVENRPMTAVYCANPPYQADAEDPRGVVLVIGNIHSGECDGKEAILMLLREIAEDPQHPWLEKLILVFAPNYNADGNDQMAPNNRPGQIGPEQGMGRRTTMEGFDLNRDFMKLDAPEARAMVRLIDNLNPDMFIDCHTTNGSKHQYQLTYDIPHHPSSPASIREYMRETMMPAITERLWGEGIKTFYYGNFDRGNTSWATYGYEPRYSTEYLGLRGKFGVLSESYSYLDYEKRIEASKAFVTACLNYFAENRDKIKALVSDAERSWIDETSNFPNNQSVALTAELQEFPGLIQVKGFQGDEPTDFSVKFLGDYAPTLDRPVPYAYLIPKDLTTSVAKLRQHGIQVEELAEAWSGNFEELTITALHQAPRAFQGHRTIRLEVEANQLTGNGEVGDFIVRVAQPFGRVACFLLEAESNDGLATWNYLDDRLQVGGKFPIRRIMETGTFNGK